MLPHDVCIAQGVDEDERAAEAKMTALQHAPLMDLWVCEVFGNNWNLMKMTALQGGRMPILTLRRR